MQVATATTASASSRRVLGSAIYSRQLASRVNPARASFLRLVEGERPPDAKAYFELGWDFAMHMHQPQPDALEEREFAAGYRAGRVHWKQGTCEDPYRRKWLNLRLSALRRGLPFGEGLTPEYLRSIDTPYCPVRRVALTHGTGGPNDASADRLNPLLGYVPGNIAIMSTLANIAKDRLTAMNMLQVVRELDRQGPEARYMDLDAREWARLATLTAFSESGAEAAEVDAWPLVVWNPRHATLANIRWAFKITCANFALYPYPGDPKVISGKKAMRAFLDFKKSLRMSAGQRVRRYQGVPSGWAAKFAGEDAWHDALVNYRWRQLAKFVPAPPEAALQREATVVQQRGWGAHHMD